METFKDIVARDNDFVFHNNSEFAQRMRIDYNGITVYDSVIVDGLRQKDRSLVSGDRAPGLRAVTATAFMPYAALNRIPKKGSRIAFDGVDYLIRTSSCEMGEIELGLERIDE